MTEYEQQNLSEAMEERERQRYSWLRQLLTLASGILAVLVSLHADKNSAGFALWCMKATWITLGIGILLGSVSLYGEVWTSSEMVNQWISALAQKYVRGVPLPKRIGVKRPLWHAWSERLCYVFLILSVVFLVIFAITRKSEKGLTKESSGGVQTGSIHFVL